MPRPAYVLCSTSGSVDQFTNKVSMFDIVEAFNVNQLPAMPKAPEGEPGAPQVTLQVLPLAVRLVSVWMRGDGDTPDVAYESQIACVCPDGQELFATTPMPLHFTEQFYRVFVPEFRFPGFPMLGVFLIEGRLRRAGATDWEWKQSFPFLVRELPAEAKTVPAKSKEGAE